MKRGRKASHDYGKERQGGKKGKGKKKRGVLQNTERLEEKPRKTTKTGTKTEDTKGGACGKRGG